MLFPLLSALHLVAGSWSAHLQPEGLGDLAREADSSRAGDLASPFLELCFRQQINHVAADGCFPIKTIRAIENHFVLFRFAIDLRGSADESVHVLKIAIQTTLVVGDDDRGMRLFFLEGK